MWLPVEEEVGTLESTISNLSATQEKMVALIGQVFKLYRFRLCFHLKTWELGVIERDIHAFNDLLMIYKVNPESFRL